MIAMPSGCLEKNSCRQRYEKTVLPPPVTTRTTPRSPWAQVLAASACHRLGMIERSSSTVATLAGPAAQDCSDRLLIVAQEQLAEDAVTLSHQFDTFRLGQRWNPDQGTSPSYRTGRKGTVPPTIPVDAYCIAEMPLSAMNCNAFHPAVRLRNLHQALIATQRHSRWMVSRSGSTSHFWIAPVPRNRFTGVPDSPRDVPEQAEPHS